MRGLTFTPVLYIIIGIILVAIALLILQLGMAPKSSILIQPMQIELVGEPTVSSVSPDSCSGGNCAYSVSISGMTLKSKGAAGNALISATYKGKRVIMPCPDHSRSQNGACTIDNSELNINLVPTFSGGLWDMPPTLNGFSSSHYSKDNGAMIPGQTVVVGNFSVKFSYFNLPTVLIKDRARYYIECNDDWRVIVQQAGDASQYTMCDGDITIKTTDLWKYEPHGACVDITTSGGKNLTYYDTINVALWNETLLECAGIPSPITAQTAISEEAALACFGHMITNWDFNVPLAAWSDGSSYKQPEC